VKFIDGNTAHSIKGYGLRIYRFAGRKYPCLPMSNESSIDVFEDNPSKKMVVSKMSLWKNKVNGFVGEEIGNS